MTRKCCRVGNSTGQSKTQPVVQKNRVSVFGVFITPNLLTTLAIHLEPKQQPSASLKVLEHTAVTDRNNVSEKKKKRKRKPVDEIDAIFGL